MTWKKDSFITVLFSCLALIPSGMCCPCREGKDGCSWRTSAAFWSLSSSLPPASTKSFLLKPSMFAETNYFAWGECYALLHPPTPTAPMSFLPDPVWLWMKCKTFSAPLGGTAETSGFRALTGGEPPSAFSSFWMWAGVGAVSTDPSRAGLGWNGNHITFTCFAGHSRRWCLSSCLPPAL